MNITEETTAVKSRLAEIENEMSEAHRDHAFEYWWKASVRLPGPEFLKYKSLAEAAFNRAHSIYCQSAKIITLKPPASAMYALYALGVVSGMIISFLTFLLIIKPN